MRFLIDEDVHECLEFILDEWQQDTLHVKLSPGLESLSDAELLDYAVDQDRIIVTYNIDDYEVLHDSHVATGACHPGIICCRQLPGYRNFGRILHWFRNLLAAESQETLRNHLRYLHSHYP